MSAVHYDHAAEIWTNNAPTGRFARVLKGQVRDYGGNVIFSGTADECAAYAEKNRPCRLVPTDWQDHGEEVAGADVTWQLVTV